MRSYMSDSEGQVKKVFNNLFSSGPKSDELLTLLRTYEGAEQARVQLAILKLSAGDPGKLRHNIEVAIVDYRVVLAWAEYPEQMETGASAFNSDPEVIKEIVKRDKDQYQTWLSGQRDS